MARIAIDARKLHDFGIGTYLQGLLHGLAELATEDDFIVLLPRGTDLPVRSARFRPIPVRAGHYGLWEHVSLPAVARRAGAELFHSPHYVLPWWSMRPAVVTIHDLIHLRFPEYLPNRAAKLYARTVMARAFRRADRVLTVSDSSKRDLLDRFGGPAEHVDVIPNSVPDVFFENRTPPELDRVRRRWDLPPRFVLYTGNVKPHKNLEHLIAALALIRRDPTLADVQLVLLGNQEHRYNGLRRTATSLGVADRVRFLGWLPQNELCCVYGLASVFAFPSLFEGFGLPPLEAMAASVPVVASNTSSLPEVCGDAALLVDPTHPTALADALSSVLTDPDLAKELVRRGHVRANQFRRRHQARETLRVYHEVLRGHG